MKNNLGTIFEKFSQGHNRRDLVRRFDMNQEDCENKNNASTEFLQIQKFQLTDLPESFEPFLQCFSYFCFNSA